MAALLSVVVPTRNRYKYLKECITTIHQMNNSDLELIIQDNSDDNSEILDFIETLQCPNLRYFYIPGQISVVENCDQAIKNSSGEYVCMLGDDDSVTDKIIDIVMFMKNKSIDACLGGIIRYNWPDLVFKHHNYPSLVIAPIKYEIAQIDIRKELKKNMSIGSSAMCNLPKVYHAIVSRKSLNKIHEKTQSFFPGPSPDMANAIALCLVLNSFIRIDIPIIVSGFSYKSTGGMGTRGAHVGQIKDIPHLPANTDELWEKEIPKIWTAETIYAESALKALRAMNELKYVKEFNYLYSYAAFICYNQKVYQKVFNHIIGLKSFLLLFYYSFRIMLTRGKNFIINTLESRFNLSQNEIYRNINSLQEAVIIVNDKIKNIDIRKYFDAYKD